MILMHMCACTLYNVRTIFPYKDAMCFSITDMSRRIGEESVVYQRPIPRYPLYKKPVHDMPLEKKDKTRLDKFRRYVVFFLFKLD